jgi:hypothetical protein
MTEGEQFSLQGWQLELIYVSVLAELVGFGLLILAIWLDGG